MYFVRRHPDGNTFFGENIDARPIGSEIEILTKDISRAAPEEANAYVVLRREREVSSVQYLYSHVIEEQMQNLPKPTDYGLQRLTRNYVPKQHLGETLFVPYLQRHL